MDEAWFREEILERFRHPKNRRMLAPSDGMFPGKNPSCGDTLMLFVRFTDSNAGKQIAEITFTGTGCAISQVAADVLSDHVNGKSVRELHAMHDTKMFQLLGTTAIAPGRRTCALLALHTLQSHL